MAFYEEHYECIKNIELPLDASDKIYLGSREHRCCRYCGETAKRAFRKTAHTIPEALGNKSLISLDECDACNTKFGELDDHFAKFLGLYRTVHQIHGKERVPVYRAPGRRPTLRRVGPNQFAGEANVEDNFIEIDERNRRGKIKGYKQPYSKRSVFKCLTKMALAILPENELENFKATLAWIRQDKPGSENPPRRFYCYRSSMGMMRNGIDLVLLRRRDPEARLPYVSFSLCFSTLTFQIFLPFCKKDLHLVGEPVHIQYFPSSAEGRTTVNYGLLDLSSPEMVRDEVDYVEFEIGEPGVIVERQDAVSCAPRIKE